MMAFTVKFTDVLRLWSEIKSNVVYKSVRSFSSCNVSFNKYAWREGRFMKKIMGHKPNVKRPWYKSDETVALSPIFKKPSSKSNENFRRLTVLNKIFMQHISDMMATGAIADEILGRGIEISRVQTAPDYKKIRVFWVAPEAENDVEIEEILEKYCWQLRHELSQLRVIGEVPPVQYIKDKEYLKNVEVNKLLTTADFGEDYVPVDAGYRMKIEFSQTQQSMPAATEQVDNEEGKKLEELSMRQELPPMRMDVLGLKHDIMMSKIKRGMKRAQALHRHDPNCPPPVPTSSEQMEPVVDQDIAPKKEDIAKFLMKRQYMYKKIIRGKKNYTPEMELYEMEALENSKLAAHFMSDIDKDTDYVDDTEDKNKI